MLGSRFLWRLFGGYAMIVVLTVAVLGVLIGRNVSDDQRNLIQRSLESDVILLKEISLPYFAGEADAGFQERVRMLGRRTATRLTVIRADGTVIADSNEDPSVMDNHGMRPEILAASARGLGQATRFSETIQQQMMYVAVQVEDNGDIIGFVRAALPLTYVAERMSQTRRLVFMIGLGGVLFALLVGLLVAHSFTKPIRKMTDVASAVSAGDYEHEIKLDRNDEIGLLAQAFDSMTTRLREHIATITADRNKTQAILAGMVEGVVAVDRDERIVHINKSAETILGINTPDAMGRRIWEATRVREASDALTAAMSEQQLSITEARVASGEQQQVIQLIATPLRRATGELDGAILVLHDVSELRELESVRRDFIANISHELKTPLTAIRGLVETLVDDGDMDKATHDRFLDKIRDQSERLSTLVIDLLTISRLESDTGGIQFESLDLRGVVAESYQALSPNAESAELDMSARVPDDPLAIDGDREALRELVDNLISNAIKYTPAGGRVSICLTTEGRLAVLEVEDNGIGIAPEHRGRIFERFYRVDKARSRQLGGTGLGLSIVKHVALSHGGNVSLRSDPGEGSVFRVQIPISNPTA